MKWTDDGDHYRFRVLEGKDTTESGGKLRHAYLPKKVEGGIHRYQHTEEIGALPTCRVAVALPLKVRRGRAVEGRRHS